ncbi:MAG: bifunctional diaminohydroxyphosphoribosylaminopyrimidine deaminase/5-amino-6-(5-phosphoribosylamino)uracil reductase RibD [Pseudomonadota bacterium]
MGEGADARFMSMALALARRGLGLVSPNPAVGCVLVKDGVVVGRGWTQPGGRPHAEVEALARAGAAANGATAYVTLEPCSHHGKTPPCVDALIAAGIRRAVIAVEDPDPRVNGKGVRALTKHGIEVDLGVGEVEARAVNEGFFNRIRQKRPMVTLKLAMSLDGRIATHTGESQWITGEAARMEAHRLRATHDAIMVGSGTALEDRPRLDCRLPGLADRSPIRIVADRRLRLPLTSGLVATAKDTPTWLVTLPDADRNRRAAFEECGVTVIPVSPAAPGTEDIAHVLAVLAERGITRLLVEGGAHLAATLLQADLVDRLAWFRAPSLIGGDGLPAIAGFGVDKLEQSPGFLVIDRRMLGDDLCETYVRVRN